MRIFKYEINGVVLTALFSILGIVVVIILGSYNVKDLTEAKKAEKVLEELKRLRIALEKYYQVTNEYPNLTLEGAKDNLRILDYTDKNGKLVSFAKIYGHDTLPKTPAVENILESNAIYNTDSFKQGENYGGWSYDYSGNTGEIHANLPINIYSQGIDWNNY
ncbi:hypothetical protein [Fusobacterium sp.]|uniref:hypothetical protein n=1 Tax=Fusobacterium sp. TaxID=68766 RepID=UPI0025BFEFC2|nr:hypothetical protein [Fusobacterium sp.]